MVDSSSDNNVQGTEVLVVGGGIAGGMASIRAAESGAQVTLVEKTNIRRSGSIAGGISGTGAVFPGEDLDLWLKDCIFASDGFVIEGAMRAVGTRTYEALRLLDEWGVVCKHPGKDDYFRVKGIAMHHPWFVHFFDGRDIKPVLDREIRKRGIEVIERVMATDLLVNGGNVCGVMGINIRSGEQVVVGAKATVLATGAVGNRLYGTATGNPFHTFTNPLDTADGQMMSLRAGAELLERVLVTTLIPKDFPMHGLPRFINIGCHIVNAHGERIMEKYDPENMEQHATRAKLTQAVLAENREGRGPCFLDFRHIPAERIENDILGWIERILPHVSEYLEKREIDLKKDLLEVQGYGYHGRRNGPLVNEKMETSLKGLFAAGDVAGFGTGISGSGESGASGLIAGESAAGYSGITGAPVIDRRQVKKHKELISEFKSGGEVKPEVFEAKLARIMSDYVGYVRNRAGLLTARKRLDILRRNMDKISVENPRELWWAFETRNLLDVARLITFYSLEREESRSAHYRSDFPGKDDKNWGKIMIARLENDEFRYRTVPMPSGE